MVDTNVMDFSVNFAGKDEIHMTAEIIAQLADFVDKNLGTGIRRPQTFPSSPIHRVKDALAGRITGRGRARKKAA